MSEMMVCIGGPCDGQRVHVNYAHGTIVAVLRPLDLQVLSFCPIADIPEHSKTRVEYYRLHYIHVEGKQIGFLAPETWDAWDAFRHLFGNYGKKL